MNSKLSLTLSIAAGFVGGMLVHVVSPRLVHAQSSIGAAQTLQLPVFVVNESGAVVASLSMDSDGQPNFKLFDAKPAVRGSDGIINVPNPIWSARTGANRP